MDILISVAVSFVVTVFAIFAIRFMDRKNRSRDEIKKFAERKIQEFDEYFKTNSTNLSNKGLDLDVKVTQTIATIERLDNIYAQFKEKESLLEQQLLNIEKINSEIEKYEEQIQELTKMSLSVEENLDQIKKDSAFISKLDGKIKEHENQLDSLEKRIPEIEKGFSSENKVQLEQISQNLLDEYKSRAESIEQATESAVSHSEEVLATINATFEDAFAKSALKAANLEVVVKCIADCCAPLGGDESKQNAAFSIMESCQIEVIK